MSEMQPNRHDLSSRNFREQRRALQGPDTQGFVRAMTFDYLCIATAITLVILSAGNIPLWQFCLLTLTAWIVIAARQHALLVLMHDATHFLASGDHKLNDWIGELFTAAPMLVSMQTYRRDHLAHHQHTNTLDDPDWVRKLSQSEEAAYWQFPLTSSWGRFMAKTWARSVLYLLRSFKHLSGTTKPTAANRISTTAKALQRWRWGLYAVSAAVLTLAGGWTWFLLLWVAPILLVLPIIMRLRSIAEHFALPYFNEFNGTRTIRAGSVERFLFAPHNVGYHLDHHLVASVPQSALPKLHQALQAEPAYRAHAHINDGYLWGRQSLRKDMQHGVVGGIEQITRSTQQHA